jgi:hypothetical protein
MEPPAPADMTLMAHICILNAKCDLGLSTVSGIIFLSFLSQEDTRVSPRRIRSDLNDDGEFLLWRAMRRCRSCSRYFNGSSILHNLY